MTTGVAVDDLTDLQTSWDTDPECDHSQHGTFKPGHAGVAAWACTTKCSGCGKTSQGLRCDQWRVYCLTVRGQVYCSYCSYIQSTHDYYANTYWRKL